MSLEVSSKAADSLPSSVKNALSKLPPSEQSVFEEEFLRKKRNPILMLLLAIFFPIQHFIEGRVGLGLIFWLTFGGFFVWYFIDIIIIWGRTKGYNEDLAKRSLRDMKIINS
ncbi:hypothetical protein HVA01_20470 [Halovibrio variabilis]|uniref:TM2 domain-containing protein n=1 Tax=Halovibrio variabilis TaxID=31910 RepID=A0A511UQU6_9GAMM|nr:TM2 domain-containing protein [Halovibrio variabilis]GEN28401.1 hypothetical protein HVA01_20470 [Halovibrio variabilis]